MIFREKRVNMYLEDFMSPFTFIQNDAHFINNKTNCKYNVEIV